MNKDIANEWCVALESDEYAQATERLRSYNGGFCCLGVLCDLYIKKFPDKASWGNNAANFPLVKTSESGVGSYANLPDEIRLWAGMKSEIGRYKTTTGLPRALVTHNDVDKLTFKQIAQVIKLNVERL